MDSTLPIEIEGTNQRKIFRKDFELNGYQVNPVAKLTLSQFDWQVLPTRQEARIERPASLALPFRGLRRAALLALVELFGGAGIRSHRLGVASHVARSQDKWDRWVAFQVRRSNKLGDRYPVNFHHILFDNSLCERCRWRQRSR
jgi:hypothetical protein